MNNKQLTGILAVALLGVWLALFILPVPVGMEYEGSVEHIEEARLGSGAPDMALGYNSIGSNYRKLFRTPAAYEDLVEDLSAQDPDRKILRFPDGQESINNRERYDPQFTQDFITFCQAAGVTDIVYRANFYDLAGSLAEYDHLRRSLEVRYIEASNEPYYGANVRVEGFREFLAWIFNKNEYERLRAVRYANKTRNLAQAFEEAYPGTWDRIAFACPLPKPRIHKYKIWYQELDRRLGDLSVIVFHIYGEPGEDLAYDWRSDVSAALDIVDPKYERISTEYGPLHFGTGGNSKYAELAGTEFHRSEFLATLELLEEEGFTLAQYHKLVEFDPARLFGKYITNNSGLVEIRYNWY